MKNIHLLKYIYRNICIIFSVLLVVAISSKCFPQGKEANVWYFGWYAGIDFNQGSPPVALTNSQMYLTSSNVSGSASIADSTGSLLFYSDGQSIWNKDHEIMLNGTDMGSRSTQGAMIVPMQENDHLYFYFNFDWDLNAKEYIFQYSIVDMNLDNGLGAVVTNKKNIEIKRDVSKHLSAIKNVHTDEVWVVNHGNENNEYHAYLIAQDSLYTHPVVSQAGTVFQNNNGYMKISPNGKKIAVAIPTGLNEFYEILDFNTGTGMVYDSNLVHFGPASLGIEFSPDNTKFYTPCPEVSGLCQYDLLAGTPEQIIASQTQLSAEPVFECALQLGPDGKIYCGLTTGSYLNVIHQPNEAGLACDYEIDAVFLEVDGSPRHFTGGLPSFIQSYLNDPEFETQHNCFGDATQFTIVETHGLDSVYWKFNDFLFHPNDTSTSFSPAYTFSHAGTFNVKLTVYSNLNERTSTQEVVIHPLPEPRLGGDTLLCGPAFAFLLDPHYAAESYVWSTGQIGVPQITISDTGTYWVRVTQNGCAGYDTIHIGLHPPSQVDTTQLQIIPTTCGGNMGIIKGLEALGASPFSYLWTNDMGDTIAQSKDVYHLSVGNYSLHVTDSNGCTNTFGPYMIHDAGEVLIEDVQYTPDYCNQQSGSITVTAVSGLGDMVFYSIDNGANYLANQGIFTNLPAGSYAIRVRDSSNCQDVYALNPLILQNIPGPQIDQVNITPSLEGQNNGAIEIQASSPCDTLYYSNNNGSTFQVNDGWFSNLSPGFYTCVVLDEYGCDTTFTVEVTEETTLRLQAIAGDDEVCPGNTAFVPLNVTNFQDVATFRANLLYNNTLLQCQGYANTHSDLQDSIQAIVFPAEGRIEITWASDPLTLPQQSTLTELVFASVDPGTSLVDWDGQPGMGYFQNAQGDDLPVDYHTGEVKIYNHVSFILEPQKEACQGEDIVLTPQLQSSNGEVTYLWTFPSGDTGYNMIQYIQNVQPQQSGIYHLLVTDTAQCQAEAGIQVIVYENPHPEISPQDTLTTEEPLEINAGSGYPSYLWNTGETTQHITAENQGWYSVVVASMQGCTGTDSVYILLITPSPPLPIEPQNNTLFFPNAFSPNSDGLNDIFKAKTASDYITHFHLFIYNRWGGLVFESKSISKGWDGKHNGQLAPEGTYVYRAEYAVGGGENREVDGVVVLVR